MNLFDYKPVIAVPRKEIEEKIKDLKNALQALEKELEERGPIEIERWGYLGVIARTERGIQTGYKHFPTQELAAKAYVEEHPGEDLYTAYYRIHRVYLGKGDKE
jgi:hypothetical protein